MAENENDEQLNATGNAPVEEDLASENDVAEGDDLENGNGEPDTEGDAEEASEGGEGAPPPADECPPCKSGAPAWMATFADMATLLMAFFVLLLSFAETELPKFKMISGALKNAFGVKVVVPTITIPMARSVLAQEFTPAVSEPTVIPNRNQKGDTTKRNVQKKTEDKPHDSEVSKDFRMVQEALAEEINAGQVQVRVEDEKVVVDLQENASSGGKTDQAIAKKVGGKISQVTLDVASKVTELQTKISSEVQVRKQELSFGDNSAGDKEQITRNEGQSGSSESRQENIKDQYDQLRAELSDEIQKGLAEVIKEGDRIIVRLANQGSFVSGSADLQGGFLPTLTKVGKAVSTSSGSIKVEGHTDNVPVTFNERFKSNWDLAAARSASVAGFLVDSAGIPQERLKVNGFADTKPVASNDTPEGRAQNRRIEVIIDG